MIVLERKEFTRCVYVQIKDTEPKSNLVSVILDFIGKNELYGFGPSTVGGGRYYSLHTEEDAIKIENFVNEWIEANR